MKIKCIGQGVAEDEQSYFILDIEKEIIKIYEVLNNQKELKVTITIQQWNTIKESVIHRISMFMEKHNYKKNRIIKGENKISKLLGKELCFLFWGIESTEDENNIKSAINNWNGFEDSERWYFYTMTNANLSIDKSKGWRGAVKKILIEN